MFGNKMTQIDKAVAKKKAAPLIKLAGSKDKQVRLAAITGLGKVETDESFNLMIPLLHDPDPDVRGAAAIALGEMGNAHAKAHLSYHIDKESDAKVKKVMMGALASIAGE